MEITNLDNLHSNDKEITLNNVKWLIPGDMPVRTVLRLIDLQQKMQENPEDLDIWEQQLDIVYKALKLKQPKLKKENLEEFLTARQMGALIGLLMSSGDAQEEEEKKTELSGLKEESQNPSDV